MTAFVCYTHGIPVRRELLEVQSGKWLAAPAAAAFARMHAAASADGIELRIVSAWRSYGVQARLYAEWKDGRRKLRPARPGFSAHQDGVAVDILRSHDDPDGAGPDVGLTDQWLEQHAASFGFYRTVLLELWHWEFKE